MNTILWISFITIICIIVVAIWLARKLLAKVKIWTPKRVGWFIGAYIVAGIIAMIVLATMEQDVVILAEEELNAIGKDEYAFREALDKAAYNQLDEQYIKQSLVYEMQSDTLTLDILSEESFYDVIIERNRDPEVREVVVKYYETPYIRFGIDVSSYIEQPVMQLENDQFYIGPFHSVNIRYNQIEPTIQIADSLFTNERFQKDSFGMRILYLNVPADVHIINSSDIYIR
ncbi:MAG: hypothetical protein ACI33M_11740 [Lysinibacillus sp.]